MLYLLTTNIHPSLTFNTVLNRFPNLKQNIWKKLNSYNTAAVLLPSLFYIFAEIQNSSEFNPFQICIKNMLFVVHLIQDNKSIAIDYILSV